MIDFRGGALPKEDPSEWQNLIPFPVVEGDPQPGEFISLRTLYEKWLRPELDDLSPNSLSEDRTALGHWERYTDDPDVRDVRPREKELLAKLRDGMLNDGYARGTINKTWRELHPMFTYAANELRIIDAVPRIKFRMKSKLVKEEPKIHRESLTFEEIERLWRGCSAATYPSGGQYPAPKLWRVSIVLFFLYGPRTEDVFPKLGWNGIKFHDRLVQFVAMKTSKLQGLPLTDLMIEHFRSIKGILDKPFGTFKTPGAWLNPTPKRPGRWQRGWRTTWRREILPAAGFKDGDVQLKHFRETMVTRFNRVSDGLGSWIAGHAEQGTGEKNYDFPKREVRDAIEACIVPECFKQIG